MNKKIKILSPATEVSMADEWFDIASTDHFWMKWRFNVIKRSLTGLSALIPGKRYLEIGCGHGQFLKQSDEQLNIITDGCDLNLFALKKIERVKGDVFVYDIAHKNPEMLNRYEGIFLLDVIEHIDDDRSFLAMSTDHLGKEGLVVINVPALQSLFSKYDVVAGHKRRYKLEDFEVLFDQCGIELLDVHYWGFLMIPLALARKIYLKFISRDKVIEKGFKPPHAFINSLFMAVMKIEMILFRNPPFGTSIVAIGRKK